LYDLWFIETMMSYEVQQISAEFISQIKIAVVT